MNDVMAVGVLRAAEGLSVKIPADLSVIGFDNREFSDYLSPRITTMDLPLHEMGYSAMETLHNMMEGKSAGRAEMPMCQLIERDSVAAPRQS
ncbi:HTH-type transcriptional repressor CytR [compost metagenome]